MAKLTIGCLSSLVGSMSLDFAMKLAEAVAKKGHQVDIWLSGNGTSVVKKGQKKFLDYPYHAERMKNLLDSGVVITACEACSEARGIGHDVITSDSCGVIIMRNFLRDGFDPQAPTCITGASPEFIIEGKL